MKFKLPFAKSHGPERSSAVDFQPPVTSPDEESRKSTIMFLVGDELRWPTRDAVLLELDKLPMFQNLPAGDRVRFANDVMAKRSERDKKQLT